MSVHKDKNNTWYVKYKNKTIRGFKKKFDAQQHEMALKLGKVEDIEADYHKICFEFLEDRKTKVVYSTYKKTENVVKNIIIPNVVNKSICIC